MTATELSLTCPIIDSPMPVTQGSARQPTTAAEVQPAAPIQRDSDRTHFIDYEQLHVDDYLGVRLTGRFLSPRLAPLNRHFEPQGYHFSPFRQDGQWCCTILPLVAGSR